MFDKIIGWVAVIPTYAGGYNQLIDDRRHGLRTARGKRIWEYLVKWSDYPVYESTW